MRDPRQPEHDIRTIRAAAASGDPGRIRLDDRVALEQLPASKLTALEAMEILANLDTACFVRREESGHKDYIGRWYDVYYHPMGRKNGFWIKIDVEDGGFVRVFSFHKSKRPKR